MGKWIRIAQATLKEIASEKAIATEPVSTHVAKAWWSHLVSRHWGKLAADVDVPAAYFVYVRLHGAEELTRALPLTRLDELGPGRSGPVKGWRMCLHWPCPAPGRRMRSTDV